MALEVIAAGPGGVLEVLGEGVPGAERRRRWSLEEKLRILAQSVAPGSSVSLTCRTHGLSSGQFYSWRKQFRCGALTGFIPAVVTPDAPMPPDLSAQAVAAVPTTSSGFIEVELPTGVRLRVPDGAGEVTLRHILQALS